MKHKIKFNSKKYLMDCEQRAKDKITGKDLNNLYDLFYLIDCKELRVDLKLNKMDKWFDEFFIKIEKIVVPEILTESKSNTHLRGNK